MRGMMESILAPTKKYERVADVGSENDPTVVTRIVEIERKFYAWVGEDGSYHEEVITDADELTQNPGGTISE